jgi:hypothetical protein
MSSLTKQLTRLRLAEANADRPLTAQERPSVLFSFREAANVSPSQVADLALEGFARVVHRLPRLQQFREALFDGPGTLDRAKLSASENDDLAAKLRQVLLLLSQDFLDADVLKVFELLLRKFEVHRFEAEHLALFLLPFHAAPTFAKVLQNVHLKSLNHWARTLEGPVISGKGVERAFIIKQILPTAPGVLAELGKLCLEIEETGLGLSSGSDPGAAGFFDTRRGQSQGGRESVHFRFFCSLVAEVLHAPSVPAALHFPLKTCFWHFAELAAQTSSQGFVSGTRLLLLLLAGVRVLTPKEIRVALLTLMQGSFAEGDPAQTVDFILALSGLKEFKLTRTLLTSLPPPLRPHLTQALSSTPRPHFAVKMLESLGTAWTKQRVPDSQSVSHLLDATRGLLLAQDPSVLCFFVSKASIIFGPILAHPHSEDWVQWGTLLKSFVEALGSQGPQLLRAVIHHSPGSPHTKSNFRRLFGDFLLFGIFEEARQGGPAVVSPTGLTDVVNSAPPLQRKFLARLREDLRSGRRVLKIGEKKAMLQFLADLSRATSDAGNLMLCERILSEMFDSPDELPALRNKIIDQLTDAEAENDSGSESTDGLLQSFLEGSHGSDRDLLFCRLFQLQSSGWPAGGVEDRLLIAFARADFAFFVRLFTRAAQSRGGLHPLLQTVLALASHGLTDSRASAVFGADERFLAQTARMVTLLWSLHPSQELQTQLTEVLGLLVQTCCRGLEADNTPSSGIFQALGVIQKLSLQPRAREGLVGALKKQRLFLPFSRRFLEDARADADPALFEFLKLAACHLNPRSLQKGFWQTTIGLLGKLMGVLELKGDDRLLKVQILGETLVTLGKVFESFAKDKLGKATPKVDALLNVGRFLATNLAGLAKLDAAHFAKRAKSLLAAPIAVSKEDPVPRNSVLAVLVDLACSMIDKPAGPEFAATLLSAFAEFGDDLVHPLLAKVAGLQPAVSQKIDLKASLAKYHLRKSRFDEFVNLLTLESPEKSSLPEMMGAIRTDFDNAPAIVRLTVILPAWFGSHSAILAGVRLTPTELFCSSVLLFDLSLAGKPVALQGLPDLAADFEAELARKTPDPKTLRTVFCILRASWDFLQATDGPSPTSEFALRLVRASLDHLKAHADGWKFKTFSLAETSVAESDGAMLVVQELRSRLGVSPKLEAQVQFCRIQGPVLKVSICEFLPDLDVGLPQFLQKWTFLTSRQPTEDDGGQPWAVPFKLVLRQAMFVAPKEPTKAFSAICRAFEVVGSALSKLGTSDERQASLARFTSLAIEILDELRGSSVQNKFLKWLELAVLLLSILDSAFGCQFAKAVDQLRTKQRLVFGLTTSAAAPASSLLGLFDRLLQGGQEAEDASLAGLAMAVHLAVSTESVPESVLGRLVFKTLVRPAHPEARKSPVKIIGVLSKVHFGAGSNLSEMAADLTPAEKQATHFLRHQPPAKRLRASKILASLFSEFLADPSFLEALRAANEDIEEVAWASDFLLFLLLNRSSEKRKGPSEPSASDVFVELESLVVRFCPLASLLACFGHAATHLQGKTIRMPFLSHLLGLLSRKLEQSGVASANRPSIDAFLSVLAGEVLADVTVETAPPESVEHRVARKSVAVIEELGRANPNLALDALLSNRPVLDSILGVGQAIGDLRTSLAGFRLVFRLARCKGDRFLGVLNEVTQSFLSLCQVRVPEMAVDPDLAETVASSFLECLGHLLHGWGSMLEPFLKDILFLTAEVQRLLPGRRTAISELVGGMAASLEFRVVLRHVKEVLEFCSSNAAPGLFEMVSQLTLQTIPSLDADTFREKGAVIFGVIQQAIELVLNPSLSDCKSRDLRALWTKVFEGFALKCSETQLSRYFGTLLKARSKQQSSRQGRSRQAFCAQILRGLVLRLGPFASLLFQEALGFCVDYLNAVNGEAHSRSSHGLGSEVQELLQGHSDLLLAIRHMGSSGASGWLDDFKFDQLSRPLVGHFRELRFGLDKPALIHHFDEGVCPALASLVQAAAHEYKTKAVVTALLSTLRSADKPTKLLTLRGLAAILGLLQEAFLPCLHETVLQVSGLTDDLDDEVASEARKFVAQVEELAGENVKALLENDDINFDG